MRFSKKYLLFLFLGIFSISVYGQNTIKIAEGSICMSDDDGNLLFTVSPSRQPTLSGSSSTGGIYDATYTRMPLGSFGFFNSPYQGAVAFPIDNLYYVFHLAEG